MLFEFRREVTPFFRLEHDPIVRGLGQALLPRRHAVGEIRVAKIGGHLHGLVLLLAHPGQDRRTLLEMLGRGYLDKSFVIIIQKGVKLVILLLREWIILVVVTLAAIDGQAEESFAQRIHTVD